MPLTNNSIRFTSRPSSHQSIEIETSIGKVEARGYSVYFLILGIVIVAMFFIYVKWGHRIPGVKGIRRKRK